MGRGNNASPAPYSPRSTFYEIECLLEMDDVNGFLSTLAMNKLVAASSQNQAFNALLFLFKNVLQKEFGKIERAVRAKRQSYISVVLSHLEEDRIIGLLDPALRPDRHTDVRLWFALVRVRIAS